MPIISRTPKPYNMVQRFYVELLNENIFYISSLLRQLLKQKHEYVIHLLPLWCKV